MVARERWEEIHRRASSDASVRAIAGELDLDRKTVRRCLRQTAWTPYERAARSDNLLTTHAEYLRRRKDRVAATRAAKARLAAAQRAADDARGRQPGQARNPAGGRPYTRAYGEPDEQAQSNFTDPESGIQIA